ncbi:MAG TPA: S41 family peptidase [Candidatus Acidoferrales bacterium]|nr:S41 family peptidase [Candidatus Acidoferrales bacterium]
MTRKTNRSARGLFAVCAVLLGSALLGGLYGSSVRATAGDPADLQESIREFAQVVAVAQQNYATPIDADKAIYNGAIPGMLRELDPHSVFFDREAFSVQREDQRGKYYGVGMTVAPRDNHTVVMAPFVGSPAYKSGIRPGDIISKVDGKPCDGLTTLQVADMLKGPKGTTVHISISREGNAHLLEFTVTRDEIPRHGVDNPLIIRPGIGYVRVVQFNETTDHELAAALDELDYPNLKGLVLDLRNNPGGLLNEGVAVADMFLDKNQLIVSHHGRASAERRYYALRGNGGVRVPLVVLINGQSASASEIVAGAIQDHDRGLIVGDTSFGKGLVQTVYNLSEGTGLFLTTARYYTPSGRLIQRDYKTTSLWDYHYNRKVPEKPTEIKFTDGGRQVTGGGGITPDVVVAAPKFTSFQTLLFRHRVLLPYEVGVGDFVIFYLSQNPTVTKDFTVDDAVINEFRRFLAKEKIEYSESELAENMDWIKHRIKQELFLSVFGQAQAYKVELDNDVQLQRAVEELPEARALYDNTRKLLAEKTAGAPRP